MANTASESITDRSRCQRCQSLMQHIGSRSFHEGARLGVLGDLAELFVNQESFELYACTRCGKIEFFIDPNQLP